MKAFISGMQDGIPITHTSEGTLYEVLTEALEMCFGIPLPEFPSDTEEEVFKRFISVIEDMDDQLAGELGAPFIVSIVDLETGEVVFAWDKRGK